MNTTNIFWIAMAAYALHMMEEFFYDWKGWANNVLKLPVDWAGFYVTNSAVLFLGIACASVSWSLPWFALAFPALMLINAFFFHVMPFIITKKFSPGLITALILFFPVGIYTFRSAVELGVSTGEILTAFLAGILLMAFPIVLLKTKNLPFFRQTM
jgi:Protein of unknown function with HXXEE motif